MEESEWRHASVDRPVPGHEIGPHGDDPGARGGRNLHLWTGRHARVSRSSGDSLSLLSDPLEPHKHTRWHDTQLVSAGGAKGTNEQHGALRKGEGPGVGDIQCRMGGKREGPIETYPKFWNLNTLTANGQEISRIPARKKSFELVKRELEAILEKEVLPASIPEFPTVRKMTLGMNSSLVVPSLFARAATEEQQREFIDGWDLLFIGYTAAIYFHTSDAKINSWTTQAKKMRGSMPPKFEVREALRILERAGLENKLTVWDDGRMIVEEGGHIALKGDEMMFATRRYRVPYGLEQVEMRQEGKELDAAGPLYVALTEYKKTGPATPSPLSVDTPGDKRSGPVEDRFRRILERREAESGEESMDETLSEAGEDMEVGNTRGLKPSEEEFTTQELLKDLSGENWADTPTPPLTSSPRKNLELPLTSETPKWE